MSMDNSVYACGQSLSMPVDSCLALFDDPDAR
jgi:hypothetical protein